MRRILFALTLAFYGFSAMELHEWLRVPQVIMHLLEEHTSEEFHVLFHEAHTGASDQDNHDHDPFDEDCHGEFCACNGLVAVAPVPAGHLLSLAPLSATVGAAFLPVVPCAFSGNVWNPPKA